MAVTSVGRRGRSDRRRSLRFPAECKVVYWSSGGWREARLMNLSRGGALVRFLHGTKVNEGVHLLLQQHGEQHRLAVRGLVKSLDNAGVHIQFNAGQTDVDGWVRRVIRTQVLPPIAQRLRSDPADVAAIAEIAAWYKELGSEVDAPAGGDAPPRGDIGAADLDRVRGVLAKRRQQLYTQFKALVDEQHNVAELERHLHHPSAGAPAPGAQAPGTPAPAVQAPPLELDENTWAEPEVAGAGPSARSEALLASPEATAVEPSPRSGRASWAVLTIVAPVVAALVLLLGVVLTLRWAARVGAPDGYPTSPVEASERPANVVHLAPVTLRIAPRPPASSALPVSAESTSLARGRPPRLASRAPAESPASATHAREVPPPEIAAAGPPAPAPDPVVASAPPSLPAAVVSPPPPDALKRAATLLKQRKMLLAIDTLRDHLTVSPHDPEALHLLALAYLALGSESEATAALEDLVASAPSHRTAPAARLWLQQHPKHPGR